MRVFDQSLSSKSLKMLTLIDEFTRERLSVEVGVLIKSERVRQVLQKVCLEKGCPEMLRSGNGLEFIGKAVNKWRTENEIKPILSNRESRGRMEKVKVSTGSCAMNA